MVLFAWVLRGIILLRPGFHKPQTSEVGNLRFLEDPAGLEVMSRKM
jgi:hypothetical protein